MAWTNPTTRSTGDLISASIYNTDIVNNLLWLRNSGGKSVVATQQATASTSYTLLTTPDQVSGVVLPADGLIVIDFQGTWAESVTSAARAAIFIGATQLKVAQPSQTTPTVQAAYTGGANIDTYRSLSTFPGGLISGVNASGGNYGGDVTTGQVIGVFAESGAGLGFEMGTGQTLSGAVFAGGECRVFAAAGTYDISVQFKASSGTVTVKNRKLWVKVEAFA